MSDPLNPIPADNYAPYAPDDSGSGSYAPSQGGYAPATQEQQSYAPNGSGDASYAPSQDGYAASAQGQQPQFGQPGADQYAQYGQPGADQYAQQPQFGQPGADQYAQYGQGAQASYGQPQQAYGQPTYGQPVYGQPMYPSPASAQFDSLRTQAIIAIVVSVISWFQRQESGRTAEHPELDEGREDRLDRHGVHPGLLLHSRGYRRYPRLTPP